MDDAVALLDKLSSSLKGLKGQAAAAQAEIDRLNAERDRIHGNIVRAAQNDAAEARENMLKDVKINCASQVSAARAEAEQILRDAHTKAAQLVADGEARVRGLEQSVITERARALLSERAAA
jgi:vacuolar-type H+-ATPase subunit H